MKYVLLPLLVAPSAFCDLVAQAESSRFCNVADAGCEPLGFSLLQKQAASKAGAASKGEQSPLLFLRLGAETGADVAPCTQEEFATKDLDIVIFGATGFTGSLAVKYLAKGHPEKPRWAIAGRHADELLELRKEVAHDERWPAVVVADLQDPASLRQMTRRARAVISYAGPYEEYGGSNLIEAAIATCTHYTDLSGEGPWKARVLAEFGDAAKARGVAVVQSLGLDSLPADLLATRASELLAEDGWGPPTDVTVFWSKVNTYVSGGTIASGTQAVKEGALVPDKAHAYALSPETPEEARVDAVAGGLPPHVGGPSRFGFDANFSAFTVPYMMGFIDGQVVRRSLGLAFGGAPIRFAEVMGQSVASEYRKFSADPRRLIDPPPARPARGQGPPAWMQEKGGLTGQGLAARGGPHAAKARFNMDCRGDPGYAATAKWSVELTMGLALKGPENGQGGYLTPALALGTKELEARLARADSGHLCSFSTGP